MTLPLSILDLAPVADGTTTPQALGEVIKLAQLGDELGFTRVWYAEHHGIGSIASSSPEVLIASSAAATKSIRVGSGGVMLPNHVPLRVVETYRTLNGFHPGRIDLGIGRAGGSDGRTLQALRSVDGSYFSQELAELLAFEEGGFPENHPFAPVTVVPEEVALPPIHLLGSSGASAEAAGQLGIGYAFAAHFSPSPAAPAFAAYRKSFRPTVAFPEPHAILALSVIAAPTDEEARFLAGSQALSWALFLTGKERKLLPPAVAAAHDYSPQESRIIAQQSPMWIIGSVETVKAEIERKVEESGADEVMLTTTIWDYGLRRRSYALLAEAFGLPRRAT